MNKPNKQETEQLLSLRRQLSRLAKSTDNLYRRMVINGRAEKYVGLTRDTSAALSSLAEQVNALNLPYRASPDNPAEL